MLQLPRNKALEEELLSAMSSLEEMKESHSEGEVQIASLSSQLLDVAKEKDGQLSDLHRQLSTMEEEKNGQIVSLLDQLSSIAAGKKLLEAENKSLQTELDIRTLVLEADKVSLESYRAMAGEKVKQLIDLENRPQIL